MKKILYNMSFYGLHNTMLCRNRLACNLLDHILKQPRKL
jgi:hypothetical protein